MACRAASTARFSPLARPMPMSAEPASFMIARTSAKSWLMRPGTVMMSLMPWTPWRRTSSTTRKASRMLVFFWTTSLSRSLGIVISASTWALSSSAAFSATSLRLLPSNANGLVTTPIVSAPPSLAICATTGAAPEPVPPPSPAVMKTMSESASAWAIFSESSSADALPDRRVAAGAEPAGDLVADADLVRRVGLEERLGIRVAGDELDAHHLGPDHPVDGVAAAAADPDDADQREVLGIGTQRTSGSPPVTLGGPGVDRRGSVCWPVGGGLRRGPGRRSFCSGPPRVHGSIALDRQRWTSASEHVGGGAVRRDTGRSSRGSRRSAGRDGGTPGRSGPGTKRKARYETPVRSPAVAGLAIPVGWNMTCSVERTNGRTTIPSTSSDAKRNAGGARGRWSALTLTQRRSLGRR